MIYYNLNTINDWFFSTDNIIKVYRNNAICYYKIDSSSPSGQTPCYAVVEDITQYSDTEFEDVYDKATEKWYKLNNLNQYEQYGIYGSGRTSCEGSTSRLPQGYTEVEYIRQNSNYDAYINTGVILFDNTSNTYTVTTKLTSEFHSNLGCATIIACENPISTPAYYGLGYRYKCSSTVDQLEFYGASPNYSASVIDNGDDTRDVIFQSTGNTSWTLNTPLIFFANWASTSYDSINRPSDATIYSSTIVKNGVTVRDFVPAKRDSDSVYGLYDLITDTFYTSPNGNNFIGGEPITPTDCVTTYEGKLTIDEGDDGEDYSKYYLTLQALESGTFGFSAGTVNYSTDSGSTWNTLTQGNTISVNQGDEVLFKMSGATPNSNTGIGTFTSSGRFNVYGNIMSMQESDNFATATTIANYEFYFKRLFAESKAVSAENMVLPATTLRNFCYNELFKGSTYLTTPPKIFPATALTQDCYSHSFRECTSLTKSPVLPALTSARASYGWMFQDCTSLSEVTCLATNVSAQYATYDWLKNVASSGTFYKNPNASWSRGTSAIPSNWSAQDYVEPTPIKYEYQYSGGSWVNVGAVTNKSYRYWMWRSVGEIVGSPSNFIQFSEFDLSVNGSDVSLSYISAAPTGVTNETADKLFDNNTSTKYCADFSSYLNTNYVLFDSTNAIAPTSFSMTTANDSRNTGRYPKDWVLLGSNTSTTNWNDGSWDTVLSGTCGNEMKVNYTRFDYPISGMEEYPIYYDEIQDPPNNLTFSSMTEAESYECPWVGMVATIDGVDYIFSGDSTSGYEWVEKPQPTTTWYTLQDLINTHTVVSKGNNKYGFDPTVNGIAFFRVHTDKVSGSNTYVDLYNDNLPSPPYFGIRDDNEIGLYQSVDGYSNLKSAADSTSCTWAYWIDANTIEVNAQAIMNDTMKIGFYTGSFSKLLLSFELPTV